MNFKWEVGYDASGLVTQRIKEAEEQRIEAQSVWRY
jgi:hypothetical protein